MIEKPGTQFSASPDSAGCKSGFVSATTRALIVAEETFLQPPLKSADRLSPGVFIAVVKLLVEIFPSALWKTKAQVKFNNSSLPA